MRTLTNIYHATLKSLQSERLVRERITYLDLYEGIEILAIGKASAAMTCGALAALGWETPGFVLSKHNHNEKRLESCQVQIQQAGHPIPDRDGLLATRALLKWSNRPERRSDLLLLLSGGASSLLVSPSPPLELEDIVALNRELLASGLPIEEMNVLRKHLSMVKGGQLGRLLVESYSSVRQLTLCDVCGEGLSDTERLSLVGSGPAIADPSTKADAKSLLEKLELDSSLRSRLANALRETPKTLELSAEILADHRSLLRAAIELTPGHFEHPEWKETVRSDIARLAPQWADMALSLHDQGLRGTLLATGEPTVCLGETARRGGRCQELALRFARAISGETPIALLAGSSDGTDGPTDYAGAIVDNTTWARLGEQWGEGELLSFLDNHDSTTALEARPETLLKTGPTGQNINDLFMLHLGRKHPRD